MAPKIYSIRGNKTIQNLEIPETSGVYLFFSKEELLYIGKATNLRQRIGQHMGTSAFHLEQFNQDDAWRVMVILTDDRFDAERLEKTLISLMSPKHNGRGKQYYNQQRVEELRESIEEGFKDKLPKQLLNVEVKV